MLAKATGLGKALRISAVLLAMFAGTASYSQSLTGAPVIAPVSKKSKASSGAPTISGSPKAQIVAGTFYDFRPSASDPNGDKLTFSINKIPRWALFDPSTGRLYGTPQASDVGRIKGIRIYVSDGTNTRKSKKGTIKVVAGKSPTISGAPPTSVKEAAAYNFQPSASDPDGQKLSFGIINKPSWANFDAATGRLYGTPPKGSAGSYANVGISVTDGANTSSLASFSITVAAAQNSAPTISGTPPSSVQTGQVFDFTPAASDADGDKLSFAIVNKPSWATFDGASGHLTGKPVTGQEGTYADVVISVSDGQLISFLPPFTVAVTTGPASKTTNNNPPVISGTPAAAAYAGVAYAFQPSASDADGDPLTFSASNLPTWLAINPSTGRLAGIPPVGSSGTYSGIVVTVSDGKAPVSLPAFSITVSKYNSPPTIAGTPPTSVKVGAYYSFKPVIADAEGDTVTLSVTNKPAWLGFNFSTGELYGTPSAANLGTYTNISIIAYDGKATTRSQAFSITVVDASSTNTPPTISGTPPTSAKEGVAYSFTPSASDADGQALRFGIANMPAWAAFDNVTGRLSGTPAVGQAGTYSNIVISVSDGQDSATLAPFSIVVKAASVQNGAPTIGGSPAGTATEGSAYSFQPTASDPDGDPLTFSASGVPGWLSFNGSTGKISGTPPKGSAGTYSGITISVSDGQVSTSMASFSITVSAAPNTTPTISGTPASTATVGQAYSFQPTASDPDGQTLAFGIANKPSWASFDIDTGKLTGTPAEADIGSYSNIVISVSDGMASATLPAFAITVKAPVIGSADLNWTAPTQNEDGSALTNLAGYKIRYGTSPGALNQVVTIASAGTTSTTVSNLAAGTWYFTVASYTNTGVESAPAGPVYKTIQ